MKQILIWMLALTVTTVAWGQTTNTTSVTINTAVPDNNQNGLATAFTLSGESGPITSVNVSVDITGGFNGDLYAYLVGPNGGFAVLLNRSGVNSGSTYGYNNTGFQVTFSDTAAYDIHNYQLHTPTYISGALQGTWQPDGGNINPQSSPSSFPAAQTAMLSSFVGTDANGQWVFFIADLSAGGQSTLNNIGVTVVTAPEPGTIAICGAGFLGLISAQRFLRKRKI